MFFFMLAVISVPRQVAERLEPSDDSSGQSLIDYSEKRSLPISIPDYQTLDHRGEKFVVSSVLAYMYTKLCKAVKSATI